MVLRRRNRRERERERVGGGKVGRKVGRGGKGGGAQSLFKGHKLGLISTRAVDSCSQNKSF